jgi:hypothetical protein
MLTRRQRLSACLVVATAWIAEVLLGTLFYSPPSPRADDVPSTEFSAGRARAILKELVGDGIPHPLGSEQNRVVRERILQYFRDFGYQPEVRSKGRVTKNIFVRRAGSHPGAAVMLASHYDSVPEGPGACDDGVAVAAIIEIARMLRDMPPTRNDIIFLITDGEESGLLGAKSFVNNDRDDTPVRVVLNFEARGTSGPSLMFQTSDDDAWLIPLFARHATRPITSSLFTEVYKTLPNDTDFTIFKAHGMEGYNFAFVRDVRNYHTRRDNYENADAGSLQHHGDNAWQMVRALADYDLNMRSNGRVIYTDLLGQVVIWWPAGINLYLAGGILVGAVIAGAIARRRGQFPGVRWRILVAAPLMLILAILASLPCAWIAGFRQLRASVSIDHGLPVLFLYWAAALSMALGSIPFTFLGRVDTWSAWLGAWFYWNVLGLLTAWYAPGMSYLFILPGAVATFAGLIAALLPKKLAAVGLLTACCAGPITAGVLWLPMQVLLYDGVGFMLPPVYPACAGLLALTIVPLVTGMPGGRSSGVVIDSPGAIPNQASAR